MCLNAINRWGLELVVQILDKFRISLLEKKNRSLSKTCICIYFSLAKKWGLLNVPDLHLIKMESIQELAKKNPEFSMGIAIWEITPEHLWM